MLEGVTLVQLAEAASDLTIIGMLVTVVYTSWKGIWMWTKLHLDIVAGLERQLAEAKTERDEWKGVAWKNVYLADRAVAKVEPKP